MHGITHPAPTISKCDGNFFSIHQNTADADVAFCAHLYHKHLAIIERGKVTIPFLAVIGHKAIVLRLDDDTVRTQCVFHLAKVVCCVHGDLARPPVPAIEQTVALHGKSAVESKTGHQFAVSLHGEGINRVGRNGHAVVTPTIEGVAHIRCGRYRGLCTVDV